MKIQVRKLDDDDFRISVEDQPRSERIRLYGSLKRLSSVNKVIYVKYLSGHKPNLGAWIVILKLELCRKLNEHAQGLKEFLEVS